MDKAAMQAAMIARGEEQAETYLRQLEDEHGPLVPDEHRETLREAIYLGWALGYLDAVRDRVAREGERQEG